MVNKLLHFTMYGIAWGGIVTFIAITLLMVTDTNPPAAFIWKNMSGGYILGIYFAFASLIFTHENWSPLKKTSIHFTLSILFWFVIAYFIGWVPLNFWATVTAICLFILTYLIFWFCFSLYYKKQEAVLNDSLSKK